MIVERAGFVISLHIEMAHGVGLTNIYFCAVQLKWSILGVQTD